MSHTPGPYFVDESGRYILASPPPKTSATIVIADVGCGAVANARLIAAAPELLDWAKAEFASRVCVCKLNPLVGGPVPCQTCQLGSLIAKATGGAE